jgi:hypothetical protein
MARMAHGSLAAFLVFGVALAHVSFASDLLIF